MLARRCDIALSKTSYLIDERDMCALLKSRVLHQIIDIITADRRSRDF